jgi:integrase
MRKKFTTRFLETVATTQVRVEYFDTDENGLMLRVSRDGAKSWAFRYRRTTDGKRRFVSLGHFPDKSLEHARLAAAKARIAVAEGADPAGGIQEKKAAPTFGDLVDEWLLLHAAANRCAHVQADDRSMLRRYILPTIGTLKVHDLGRRDLVLMLAKVRSAKDSRKGHQKQGAEPRALSHRPNRVFGLTRAILRWALAEGLLTSDPTAGMKRPIKREPSRERELSPDEIKLLWHNLEHLPATQAVQFAIKLALVTGQRIGEICGIAKNELHLDGADPVWIIPSARTKNAEGHRVPLSALAVSLIRDALELQQPHSGTQEDVVMSPFLFPARAKRDKSHGPIEGGAATVAMFRGRDKLGIAHFCIHDLRRTAATRMAELGINPHTISLILNHVSASKNTVTTKIYVRYSYDKEKRAALDLWGQRLEEILRSDTGSSSKNMQHVA